MKMSTEKTAVMAFDSKDLVKWKIVVRRKTIKQVNVFKYLGTEVSYRGEVDVGNKIAKFLKVSGPINRILPANTIKRETRLKVYNSRAIPVVVKCGH